ncbi:hypothetical protein AVEN_199016-1 [Araneus ventricosus]|uniref:Uncharacterized protein n=1 Tax=Araneus ventricosus TaxID=182803 RepID=A0A4Y2QIK4_ARAVE|nr:hypothetical protein AVEN_199016-1 [Araneus ventricosus]
MEGDKKGDEKKAEGDCEKGGECGKVSKGATEKEGAPAQTQPAASSGAGERKDSTTESLIQVSRLQVSRFHRRVALYMDIVHGKSTLESWFYIAVSRLQVGRFHRRFALYADVVHVKSALECQNPRIGLRSWFGVAASQIQHNVVKDTPCMWFSTR